MPINSSLRRRRSFGEPASSSSQAACSELLGSRFALWTQPLTASLPLATLADLGRSTSQLCAENALLRQQLIMLQRQVKRPVCSKVDRTLLVLLASLVRTWQQALLIVQTICWSSTKSSSSGCSTPRGTCQSSPGLVRIMLCGGALGGETEILLRWRASLSLCVVGKNGRGVLCFSLYVNCLS
jgi:hypothetical protein